MSEHNRPTEFRGANMAEEQVRRLLEQAGARPAVPPEDLAQIKAAFRTAWEEHLGQRQVQSLPRRFDRRLLALAAGVLLAVALGWWWWSFGSPAGASPVARVESLAGVVTARVPGERGEAPAGPLVVGGEVVAGAELETSGGEPGGAGHAALRLAGGSSLRLDAGSRARLVSASVVELEHGAVYLDSRPEPGPGSGPDSGGGSGRAPAVAVRTPVGVATEIGTQFEVRLLGAGEAMRVRVREGEVHVEGGGGTYSAVAGAELTLHADGSVTRERIAAHGAPWQWVLAAAPPFEIEGLTLAQFLAWVGRETGLTVRYADPGLAAEARSILVHGSIAHLTPGQAPGVVLPGAGLEHQVTGGALVVRAAGESGER